MKKTIQLITIWLIALAMQAQTISEQQARQTAAEFYQTHEANKSFWLYKAYEAPHQALYVFNNPEETGFVIIAGDERANNPILGWSDNGPFDYDNAPCALKALLEQYASSLEDSSYGCLGMSKKKDRNTPKHNTSGKTEVTPLLTTQWSQGAPYNNLCPVNSYGDHYFTGCVITAMAQVMNYYQWPKQGRGKHTNADTGQSPRYVQTCDFSRSRYDWENMIDNYETMEYTDAQAFAVAQLMADLGCAMDASYIDLTYGTSAISEYIPAMAAKYFHYKTLLYPENTSEEDWTAEQYEEKRRMFLEQGHPLRGNARKLTINKNNICCLQAKSRLVSQRGGSFILRLECLMIKLIIQITTLKTNKNLKTLKIVYYPNGSLSRSNTCSSRSFLVLFSKSSSLK